MTSNEISMLAIGFAAGANGVSLLHAYWTAKDARRDATASRAAVKQTAGDRYLSSLRVYQLQHRTEAGR